MDGTSAAPGSAGRYVSTAVRTMPACTDELARVDLQTIGLHWPPMPHLFSYGTLQDPDVQLAAFGRHLEGHADTLRGFERGRVAIVEPDVLATGMTHYENAVFTGRPEHGVDGVAYDVTDAELADADRYEAAAHYVRIAVTLASGTAAWVYVHGHEA